MDPNDNTAVCLRDLKAGEKVSAEAGTEIITANVQDQIPRGHKICVREIQAGEIKDCNCQGQGICCQGQPEYKIKGPVLLAFSR